LLGEFYLRNRAGAGFGLAGLDVFIGLVGFEPTASCTRGRRSTKLSHSPYFLQVNQRPERALLAHFIGDGKRLGQTGQTGGRWAIKSMTVRKIIAQL
jgi:hypothetical protein